MSGPTMTDDTSTKLTRLLEILGHEHVAKCFSERLEDCGEHHAHNKLCLTRRDLVCSTTDRYRMLVLQRATPALLALVKAAVALPRATGGHLYKCASDYGMPCDCDIPALDAALDLLAKTDIRW